MYREVVSRHHSKLATSKVRPYRVRALGCDLGTKNFALTVVDGYRNNRFNTIDATMLEETLSDLTEAGFTDSYNRCKEAMTAYILYWKPDIIVLERFMNRGRFNGASGEKVSIMIGIIAGIALRLKIHVVLVSASTWKNRFTHWFGRSVKEIYELMKPLPPHLIDGQLQAIYGIRKWHAPEENPYAYWKLKHAKQLHDYWIKPERKRRKKAA